MAYESSGSKGVAFLLGLTTLWGWPWGLRIDTCYSSLNDEPDEVWFPTILMGKISVRTNSREFKEAYELGRHFAFFDQALLT